MSMQPQTSHQGSSLQHNFSEYFNRTIHPRSVARCSRNIHRIICCLSGEVNTKSGVGRRQWGSLATRLVLDLAVLPL